MWMSALAQHASERTLCSLSVASEQSVSPVVYGCVLAASSAIVWALMERRERRALWKQNSELSSSLIQITEQHYRERVQAEERHLLAHDSSVRTVHESVERMLLGKPRN